MAYLASRASRRGIDHRETVVDVVHPVHGASRLDGEVVHDITRYGAPKRHVPPLGFHRQSSNAHAPPLELANNPQGQRRSLLLPWPTHAHRSGEMTRDQQGNARAFPRPRKRLGQHFLTDPRILARIADAAELTPEDTVVEIGPGRGALTEHLLARARRVVAIEIDNALVARLGERFAGDARLSVVGRDVLDVDIASMAGADYVLVGNVPYYITTPILFHALQPPRPARAIFLVQREVAQRMSASPSTKAYGALTVNLAALARVELLFRVPPGAFTPPPTVDSAVVRIVPRTDPVITRDEEAQYRVLVQGAFGMRRKQMRRVLRSLHNLSAEAADAVLQRGGIDPEARPEALTPEQFAMLLRSSGSATV